MLSADAFEDIFRQPRTRVILACAMFFHVADIEWPLILAATAYVFWFTWRKASWTRMVGLVVTIPLGLLAALIVGAFIISQLTGSVGHGAPIYSPNGKNAALLWTRSGRAIGGGSWVELYDSHGLRRATVFEGGWHSVDVHWADDTHVTIRYDYRIDYDDQKTCEDFHSITVVCERK